MSELGVIGATYEDRRNGRIGKLISRDEKCKTLMFEAPGGKNFITSYSGFRSNMRKKEVEVSAETSNEVTETAPTEEVQESPVKESKKTKKLSVVNHPFENGQAMYLDMSAKISKYVDTFNNRRLKITSRPEKNLVALSLERNHHIINMHIVYRALQFRAYMKEEEYLNTPWTVNILSVYKHITYTKPICVYVSYDQLEQFLEDIRPIVVDSLVKKSKHRDMKEEL